MYITDAGSIGIGGIRQQYRRTGCVSRFGYSGHYQAGYAIAGLQRTAQLPVGKGYIHTSHMVSCFL
jgi:hypothetical protein